MLHAIGLTDEDFKKPLIGIASTGYEGNPCNSTNELSVEIKKGQRLIWLDYFQYHGVTGFLWEPPECVSLFHRATLLLIQ